MAHYKWNLAAFKNNILHWPSGFKLEWHSRNRDFFYFSKEILVMRIACIWIVSVSHFFPKNIISICCSFSKINCDLLNSDPQPPHTPKQCAIQHKWIGNWLFSSTKYWKENSELQEQYWFCQKRESQIKLHPKSSKLNCIQEPWEMNGVADVKDL